MATFNGGNGNDTLLGAAALTSFRDSTATTRLNGAAGNDTMNGGNGSDVFIVNATGDAVVELAGQGTDTIRTTVATYSLLALPEVENLT